MIINFANLGGGGGGTAGVSSLNGQTGALTTKTIGGESILGTGDIPVGDDSDVKFITDESGMTWETHYDENGDVDWRKQVTDEYNAIKEIYHRDCVEYVFTHSGSTWGSNEAWVATITNGVNSFNYGIWQEGPNSRKEYVYVSGNYGNGYYYRNDNFLTRPMIRTAAANDFYSRFPGFYLKFYQENSGDDNITWTFVVPSSYSVEILSLENCPGFEFAGSAATEFVEIAPANSVLLDSNFSAETYCGAFHHYIITHRFEEDFDINAEKYWGLNSSSGDQGMVKASSMEIGGNGGDMYLPFYYRDSKFLINWMNNQFLRFGRQDIYTLPKASSSTLGGVKIGSGISIDSGGTISVEGGSDYVIVEDLSAITNPTEGMMAYVKGTIAVDRLANVSGYKLSGWAGGMAQFVEGEDYTINRSQVSTKWGFPYKTGTPSFTYYWTELDPGVYIRYQGGNLWVAWNSENYPSATMMGNNFKGSDDKWGETSGQTFYITLNHNEGLNIYRNGKWVPMKKQYWFQDCISSSALSEEICHRTAEGEMDITLVENEGVMICQYSSPNSWNVGSTAFVMFRVDTSSNHLQMYRKFVNWDSYSWAQDAQWDYALPSNS